jgi:hypothetical protein
MNERIKRLIDEAVKFRLDPDSNSYEAQVSPEDLEVFAELIVQECANIVQDSPWQLPQGYKSVDQAKLVKKYFGVE